MYVYDCNYILITAMKNRSDKEMIQDFKKSNTDLKSCGINPVLHFMDNKESTALKMAMPTMDINYQLSPPINHKEKLQREKYRRSRTIS